ncbi:hypothetical protein [Mycobacteroides abscessus]|uniref:hypothetical protein n=1 Tax=Mycobacteroides abscessus TaxID=36809 RepID=UPI002648ADDE|nr:hypothetical protein [Mycobacteroides abscessus]MDO3357795.1 hypothetical protein [Mycobacteroides abscessus subsp. massiliense]WKE45634.1 hypothetical protein P3M63_07470 [Mycobacteroides abscessus subsp. massiliense]
MSSSPFDAVTSTLTDLAGAVGVLTAPRLHPMDGDTADRANDLAQSMSHSAVQTEDWLAGLVETSQAQAELDHKLSSCMTPTELAEWRTRIARLGDRAQQMAEISPYLAEEKKRREALAAHAAGTFSSLPDAPGSCDVSANMEGSAAEGQSEQGGKTKTEQSDPQGLGGALEEEEGAPESGTNEETPVTMSTGTPETPVTMSTGAPREAPVTMSDTAANTELSSSTMTDPSTRAALSGQVAQGQGTPQVGQPSTAAMGGVPVSHQLSQPARGGAGASGTVPRSPEARRDARDRQDEKDATVQAAAGVTMAGAGGAMGAAMTSTPSSPSTMTSGAPSTPVAPATPPPSTAQGTPPAGAGGAGMAGMGRGATLGSGNGVSNTKPVMAAEQPLTPAELDKLLRGDSEGDKKDGSKK